jgi:sugar-specific transcriptional regulator TrmB
MIARILQQNGFSEKEANVYLTVLAKGEVTIGQIATQSHINRTTVYSIVDGLEQKGIVFRFQKHSTTYISALSPRILVERFKSQADEAQRVLPDLLDLAYASPLRPRLRFFEGVDGLKRIFDEFALSSTEPVGVTNYASMPQELLVYIRNHIVPTRKKRGISARFLLPDNELNREIQSRDEYALMQHRIRSFPWGDISVELSLFGTESVSFSSFKSDEMFGVIIDSRAMYDCLKNMFEMLWGR